MRDVAYTALLKRCPWFEDMKMNDTGTIITEFLRAWKEAMYRHDTGGRNIYQWAATWSEQHREEYEKRFPYLAGIAQVP